MNAPQTTPDTPEALVVALTKLNPDGEIARGVEAHRPLQSVSFTRPAGEIVIDHGDQLNATNELLAELNECCR